MMKTALAKIVATKLVATAAVASTATGAVALAAATGSLPAPLQHTATASHAFPAPQPATSASTRTPDTTARAQRSTATHSCSASKSSRGASSKPTVTSSAPDAAGTPSHSLNGLCKAYQAGAAANPGRAASSPAFTALATAAGTNTNIVAYCITLIGAPSSHPRRRPELAPDRRPGPATRPAGR